MSKNDEKSNNPFAKLAAMQFPDKNAPEKARRVSVPAEKHKPSDVSFDDDERLFLASIGEVSALGFDKKVYAGFSEKFLHHGGTFRENKHAEKRTCFRPSA